MNDAAITSKLIDLGKAGGAARVNRVTLGLLLIQHFAGGATMGRTSAYPRLERAIGGLSSALLDYEQAELISAAQFSAEATYQMWLTQCDTILGYLTGSGADQGFARSFRRKIEEIPFTSEGRLLHDEAVSTIRRGRAAELTRWALGDGRFNRDMGLAKLWGLLWSAENDLRGGLQLSWRTGLTTGDLVRRSSP